MAQATPDPNGGDGNFASLGKRAWSRFKQVIGPPQLQTQQGPSTDDLTNALVNALKTNGLIPEIDYNRMAEAVATGIQEAQSATANQPGRPPQPRTPGAPGARQRQPKRSRAPIGLGGVMSVAALWAGNQLLGREGGGWAQGGAPSPQDPAPVPQGSPPPPPAPARTSGQLPFNINIPPTASTAAAGGTEAGGTAAVGAETAEAAAGTTAAAGAAEAGAAGGIAGVLGRGLLGFGGGGGLSGAWEALAGGGAASEILGPIGLGLTAGYEGLNMLAAQRQLGAYYQGITGGNIWQGEAQRAQGIGFRLSQLGNLSGAQANALFQGTTGLDMTGAQRTNAMNTAIQMYDQLGVSIQSSIQNITIAAQSGNKELAGLAQAIDNVTQAAVQGGVNANVARQNFTNLYGATTQTITGAAAVPIASGIAAAQTGMGQLLQGANLSGLTSMNTMLLLASRAGQNGSAMGIDQFLGEIQGGNTAAYSNALRASLTSNLASMNLVPEIGTAARSLGLYGTMRRGALTQNDIQRIGTELETQNPNQGLAMTLPMLFQQLYGVSLNTPQALAMAVGGLTGNFAPDTTTPTAGRGALRQRQIAPTGPGTITRRQIMAPTTAALDQTLRTYIRQNYGEYSQAQQQTLLQEGQAAIAARAANPDAPLGPGAEGLYNQVRGAYQQQYIKQQTPVMAAAQRAERAVGMPSTISQAWESIFGATSGNAAREWYINNIVAGKGQRDPVMEQLLKNPELNAYGTVFSVDTGQGNKPILATAQELEQHYMKAVQSGQVKVASSASNPNLVGQNIAQVLGIQAQGKEVVSGTKWASSQAGQAAQKQLQQQVTQQTKNIVTVVPSQALLQWMQFQGQGNVSVQNDTNTATNQTQPQYPLPALPST